MTTPDDGLTREGLLDLLHRESNWGRWGDDDRLGAMNLIDDAKRVRAAGLVRSGKVLSLAHPLFDQQSAPDNPEPPELEYESPDHGEGTSVLRDTWTPLRCHGYKVTHVDALNHVWTPAGMWNGRDPQAEVQDRDVVEWGDVSAWSSGLTTRGVFVDVPRFRGEPFVTQDRPVLGSELRAALAAQQVALEPGDALLVYSGRERWTASTSHGHYFHGLAGGIPGLHASCLTVLRESDVAVMGWDMLEAFPDAYGLGPTIHQAIWSFGLALVDNCRLDALAETCAREDRYEFLFTCAPLPVTGGTGSLVNPLAML